MKKSKEETLKDLHELLKTSRELEKLIDKRGMFLEKLKARMPNTARILEHNEASEKAHLKATEHIKNSLK